MKNKSICATCDQANGSHAWYCAKSATKKAKVSVTILRGGEGLHAKHNRLSDGSFFDVPGFADDVSRIQTASQKDVYFVVFGDATGLRVCSSKDEAVQIASINEGAFVAKRIGKVTKRPSKPYRFAVHMKNGLTMSIVATSEAQAKEKAHALFNPSDVVEICEYNWSRGVWIGLESGKVR